MFLPDPLKIRWTIPAPPALIRTRPLPGFSGIEIVNPFPAKFLPKDRTHFLQPIVDRADTVWAGPFVLVVGKTQTIVILDTLTGPFRSIFRVGIIIAKAGSPVGVHVERGLALGYPFCHELADASCATVAVKRHTGCDPHAACPSHGPKHGLAIRGVSAWMADQGDDPGLVEERNAADGPFQQLFKTIVVCRQRGPAVLPRHAVDPARQRVRFVAADHQSARLLAHVHQVVRVTQAGGRRQKLAPGDRFQGNVLMIHRGGRDIQPGHRGNPGRPQPGGVDHDLGPNGTMVGNHTLDLAPG